MKNDLILNYRLILLFIVFVLSGFSVNAQIINGKRSQVNSRLAIDVPNNCFHELLVDSIVKSENYLFDVDKYFQNFSDQQADVFDSLLTIIINETAQSYDEDCLIHCNNDFIRFWWFKAEHPTLITFMQNSNGAELHYKVSDGHFDTIGTIIKDTIVAINTSKVQKVIRQVSKSQLLYLKQIQFCSGEKVNPRFFVCEIKLGNQYNIITMPDLCGTIPQPMAEALKVFHLLESFVR